MMRTSNFKKMKGVKVVKMRWIEYSHYLKSSVCGVVVAGP